MISESSIVRLKTGQRVVLAPFFDRVAGQQDIRHLIWVSPWMTHIEFATGNTRRLLKRLERIGPLITVITREPKAEDSEVKEFLEAVWKIPTAQMFYLPNLHAKYYVCHTPRRSFAAVGSFNLYRWTENSIEVGVYIEGRSFGESLIDELDAFTYQLKCSNDSTCAKQWEIGT